MIIYTPPDTATPRLISLVFKMELDPISGTFKVDAIKELLDIKGSAIYLLDNFNIGSNLSDSSYYEAIKEVPTIEIIETSRLETFFKFPSKIPVSRVGAGDTLFTGYFGSKSDDKISLKVVGELDQTINTIDVETIDIRVSCTIYEITSQDFIREFEKNAGK